MCILLFSFFYSYVHHRDLHSFPTRRSSDLTEQKHTMEAPGTETPTFDEQSLRDELKEASQQFFSTLFREASLRDRKSTRLNSSHLGISYAVFCLKKKKKTHSQKND